MLEYKFDPETQRIYKTSGGKKDQAKILLYEGRVSSHFLTWLYTGLFWRLHHLDERIGRIFRAAVMKKMKVVPNRITFGTFQESYADNCKYIAEKIAERGLDYELIFIVNEDVYAYKDAFEIPAHVRLVQRDTMEMYYALATSKFWIDNALMCIWKRIPKKKEQIYLNTWHGSLGIKKLKGTDMWKQIAKNGDRMIDYFLTDSVFDEQVFSQSFWPNVKHMKVGHPRNDIFFDQNKIKELRKKVYDYYKIPPHVKTVLYAPTFRDNKKDISAIDVNFQKLTEALTERFGGEWMVINRLHFHNAINLKTKGKFQNTKGIINASQYPDMQELLAAADVGITDYSSWIFDYLFTGRPAFIYAADIEKYRNDRGFYYSLDETPFLIASTNEMLGENIRSFDSQVFHEKVEEFLKNKGCYEAGKACDQVVDFIINNTK